MNSAAAQIRHALSLIGSGTVRNIMKNGIMHILISVSLFGRLSFIATSAQTLEPVERSVTSWYPPSTILVAETSVIFAFF